MARLCSLAEAAASASLALCAVILSSSVIRAEGVESRLSLGGRVEPLLILLMGVRSRSASAFRIQPGRTNMSLTLFCLLFRNEVGTTILSFWSQSFEPGPTMSLMRSPPLLPDTN